MRFCRQVAVVTALLLAVGAGVHADESADEGGDAKPRADSGRWTAIPILAYTPETSVMLGGGAIYTFRFDDGDPHGRRSNAALTAIYTLENQFVLGFGGTLYLDDELWRLNGSVEGALFPSTIYAVGPDSPAESAEDYTDQRFGIDIGAGRLIASSLRVGATVSVGYSAIEDVEPGGRLDTGTDLGADGGLIIGMGPAAIWDSRDRESAPSRGGYYRATARLYPDALGDYGFGLYELTARHFVSVLPDHVLAVELFGQFSSGDIPFQSMPAVGGQYRMRGYFHGRFRDDHMLAAQLEYRFPVWRRFGAVVFGSVGDVAPALDEFAVGSPEVAGGVGVRWAISPKDHLNVRFDVGVTGDGDANVYVALGEAF